MNMNIQIDVNVSLEDLEMIKKVIKLAEEKPTPFEILKELAEGYERKPAPGGGRNSEFTLYFPQPGIEVSIVSRDFTNIIGSPEFCVTYTHEEQSHNILCRHMSVSINIPNQLPTKDNIREFMKLYGFKNRLERCYVWSEKFSDFEQKAINVVEPVSGDFNEIEQYRRYDVVLEANQIPHMMHFDPDNRYAMHTHGLESIGLPEFIITLGEKYVYKRQAEIFNDFIRYLHIREDLWKKISMREYVELPSFEKEIICIRHLNKDFIGVTKTYYDHDLECSTGFAQIYLKDDVSVLKDQYFIDLEKNEEQCSKEQCSICRQEKEDNN